MSIAHFSTATAAAGASGAGSVTISDQTVANIFTTTSACAGVKLTRGGQFHTGADDDTTTVTYSDVGGAEWAAIESSSVGDAYECRMVTLTGTLSVGTADSWLALTSDRSWEVLKVGNGTKAFTGTLEIRLGTGAVLDSAAISLVAFVDVA